MSWPHPLILHILVISRPHLDLSYAVQLYLNNFCLNQWLGERTNVIEKYSANFGTIKRWNNGTIFFNPNLFHAYRVDPLILPKRNTRSTCKNVCPSKNLEKLLNRIIKKNACKISGWSDCMVNNSSKRWKIDQIAYFKHGVLDSIVSYGEKWWAVFCFMANSKLWRDGKEILKKKIPPISGSGNTHAFNFCSKETNCPGLPESNWNAGTRKPPQIS